MIGLKNANISYGKVLISDNLIPDEYATLCQYHSREQGRYAYSFSSIVNTLHIVQWKTSKSPCQHSVEEIPRLV